MFDAFITGSHAYGTPGPKSDIDLVLPLDPEVIKVLRQLADTGSDPPGSTSMRFGKVNLIVPDTAESLKVWPQGTAELAARKPVTRSEAVSVFVKRRRSAGIT